jgi:hypothetical protein
MNSKFIMSPEEGKNQIIEALWVGKKKQLMMDNV